MAGTQSIWLGALLLAGCGFEAMPAEEDMGTDPVDTDPLVARNCATDDNSLALCIDFEDTEELCGDGSGHNHVPLVAEGVTSMNRDTERAAQLSSSSRLQIAEHADLDITTNLTVSMWAKSDSRPAAQAWMLDNNTQYAMSLLPSGKVRCGLGASTIDSATEMNVGGQGWHQVACTYDGHQLRVYIDGWVAGCKNLDRPIATTGTEGIAIGSNIGAGPVFTEHFVGGLDNVEVFARTFSASELCSANGTDWCNSSCALAGGEQ